MKNQSLIQLVGLNIEVTGSGTETPEGVIGTELYTATDPGILFSPYGATIDYTVPGPPLFGSGGSGTTPTKPSTPSAAPSASSTPSAPAASPSSPAASSSPVATPEAEPSTAPSATPSAAPSTGGDALPESFTIDTFISWLEGKASGSASKARRHARSFL